LRKVFSGVVFAACSAAKSEARVCRGVDGQKRRSAYFDSHHAQFVGIPDPGRTDAEAAATSAMVARHPIARPHMKATTTSTFAVAGFRMAIVGKKKVVKFNGKFHSGQRTYK